MRSMIRVLLLSFAATLLLAPVSIHAEGTRTPVVNRRERRQRRRIRRGVKSGQLTKDEAKGLRKEETQIRQEKREMKSDGNVTPEERKQLNQDLNKTSHDIYQEKHDAETR